MKIPTKQSDILLSTYLEYDLFLKRLTPQQLEDEAMLLRNTIKIFYMLSDEEIEQRPYTQLQDMYKIIQNILLTPQDLVETFKINDIEYGINPDFGSMTLGELVDCDTADVLQQIAVLYRPIISKKGNKYTIEKYKADIGIYDELKKRLTLDVYTSFIGFFLRIQESLMNYTLKSLMVMGLEVKQKSVLAKLSDGIRGYTNFATTTLPNLTR